MEPMVQIHLSYFSQDKSRVEEEGDKESVPGPLVPTGKCTPYDLHPSNAFR